MQNVKIGDVYHDKDGDEYAEARVIDIEPPPSEWVTIRVSGPLIPECDLKYPINALDLFFTKGPYKKEEVKQVRSGKKGFEFV